jgi:hypothetical protein
MGDLTPWLKECAQQKRSEEEVVSQLIDQGYDLDEIERKKVSYRWLLRWYTFRKYVFMSAGVIVLLLIIAYVLTRPPGPLTAEQFNQKLVTSLSKQSLPYCLAAADRSPDVLHSRSDCYSFHALAANNASLCDGDMSANLCYDAVAVKTGSPLFCRFNTSVCGTRAIERRAMLTQNADRCYTDACRIVVAVYSSNESACPTNSCTAAARRDVAACADSTCLLMIAVADKNPAACGEFGCSEDVALVYGDSALCTDEACVKAVQELKQRPDYLVATEKDRVLDRLYLLTQRKVY